MSSLQTWLKHGLREYLEMMNFWGKENRFVLKQYKLLQGARACKVCITPLPFARFHFRAVIICSVTR